ncbi:MAG TPA: hypothetical protein VFS65_00705 [Candidatus Saccharimonadales bacterium]|nr:hypothetical protein [Candidatus Saccharimonadales bacterium]
MELQMTWAAFKEWVYQVLIAEDQRLNAWTGGTADETLSSRCFRLNHKRGYRIAEIVINALFFPFQGKNHCESAYVKEVRGRHLPSRFYDLAYAMNVEFDIRRKILSQ